MSMGFKESVFLTDAVGATPGNVVAGMGADADGDGFYFKTCKLDDSDCLDHELSDDGST